MSDLLVQAESIERLLGEAGDADRGRRLFEATLQCVAGLVDSSLHSRALELLDGAAAQLCGTLDAAARLRLEVWAVRALYGASQYDAAVRRADEARTSLHEALARDAESRQILGIYEGGALTRLDRDKEAEALIEGIRRELLGAPDTWLLAAASLHLSTTLINKGDRSGALRYALDALVTARRIGSARWEATANINLCFAERQLCHWASAEAAAREALAVAKDPGLVSHALRGLALSLWKRGRLAEAAEMASESTSTALAAGISPQRAFGMLFESAVRTTMGEFEAAREMLDKLEPVLTSLRGTRPDHLSHEYRGDSFLEAGAASEALEAYETVWPEALALVPRGDIVAELRRRRAECYLLLGDPARAHGEALEAITHTRELGDRYEEAATYRIAALAAAALGRPDEAKKHFTQGFAYYDDIETPYEWGKLWMSYGDWLCGEQSAHYRDLSGAHEAYRAAEQHFEQMGAEHKLTEARARIANLAEQMKAEGEALSGSALKARPRRRPRADRELQQRAQWAFETFGLVTRHRPLLEMLEQVSRVAASDLPVLVLGESGTGKELVARGVHFVSGRTGRFVEVNCSAVPASIMESEFFGSSHGSYTGSTRDRTGLLEDAHLGSFFLDEIGEMSLDLQSKLLRFLETGRVRRIGETDGRQVDVRLIAATNRAHDKLKTGSGFREDLYYRLAHAVIEMPPLRERGDDVELLLDHFLDKFCDEARKPVALSPAAREKLLACTWPGNVRQLRALIHRFVLQSPAGHVISPREIPADDAAAAPRNFLEEMEGQEKRRIQEALERAHFVKADAARFLRMSRTTLIGKMKRYGITA